MPPETLQIVFDRFPPSARGKYQLTLAMKYEAQLKDARIGLYSIKDDAGTPLNISVYGQGYGNNGNWHICKGEGCEFNTCEPEEEDDDDDGDFRYF
jgi:hypothetical protein